MPWMRALLAWLLIIVVESIHGTLRTLYVVPVIGDVASRQLGVPVAALLTFAIACLVSNWLGARTVRQQLGVGALWVALTVVFEFVLGRLVFDMTWDRMLADYDVRRGGLMLFGMVAVLLSPLLAARLRAN